MLMRFLAAVSKMPKGGTEVSRPSQNKLKLKVIFNKRYYLVRELVLCL